MTIRINQHFEGTGFDNGESWVTGVGVGNTVDEDALSSDVGSPVGWGEQALKLDIATPANAAQVNYSWGIADPIAFFSFEVIINSDGLTNGQHAQLAVGINNAGSGVCWTLRLIKSGALLLFQIDSEHDGSDGNFYTATNTPLSLDTKYRIEVKWDATNDAWAWRVDGVDQPNNIDASFPITSEGTLTSTHVVDSGILLLGTGLLSSLGSAILYYDRVFVSTSDWVSIGEGSVALPIMEVSSTITPAGNIILPAITMSARTYNGSAPECIVMNTKNNAVSEYLNYGFNSMTRFNGANLIADQNGIYEQDSSEVDDSVYKIKCAIKTGRVDTWREVKQLMRNGWLNYQTDGDARVTTVANKTKTREYYLPYVNIENLDEMVERRIKFERGIKERYFDFKIENVDGANIEIDKLTVTLEPVVNKRR
jgi:hypothetical protein